MKKSKVILSKKLSLIKSRVSPLSEQQTEDLVGGATTIACNTLAVGCTQVTVLCPPQSRLIICVTSPATLGCNVCQ